MQPAWIDALLEFWFFRLTPKQWFEKSDALDETLRVHFLQTYETVSPGFLPERALTTPDTVLAYLILLDQFPRNMFRGTARMFEGDAKALQLAHRAHADGLDQQVEPARRLFFYLPFEHSEALADQDLSVALCENLGDPAYLKFAIAHRDIIARFGRFPHRNQLLQRPSKPEELAFLAQPGSSF